MHLINNNDCKSSCPQFCQFQYLFSSIQGVLEAKSTEMKIEHNSVFTRRRWKEVQKFLIILDWKVVSIVLFCCSMCTFNLYSVINNIQEGLHSLPQGCGMHVLFSVSNIIIVGCNHIECLLHHVDTTHNSYFSRSCKSLIISK